MYYAVVRSENYLSHSKGPWRVHKYLRKVGKKYYYYDKNKSNESKGIRTYSHIRTDDEHSNQFNKNVKEIDYIQEVNSNSWFSSWDKHPSAFMTVNNKGETVANYYSMYRIGKIERFARDNEAKVKKFVSSFFGINV